MRRLFGITIVVVIFILISLSPINVSGLLIKNNMNIKLELEQEIDNGDNLPLAPINGPVYPIPPVQVQNAINNMTKSVSSTNLKNYLLKLQNFGSRLYRAPGMFNASIWLHDVLKGNGRLEPSYHNFTIVRPRWGPFNLSNVILTLPGLNESSDRIYYMFAHSDAVQWTNTSQWLTNTPGADDDGSGCVATLEAARILSNFKFQDTIKFAFFNAEETGLNGSRNYAENMSKWGENVWGSIDYDMIGYSSGQYANDLRLRYNSASAAQGLYEVGVNDRYDIGLTINATQTSGGIASDIQSFYNFGFRGVFAIEYEFNPYYHSTSDRVKYINFTLINKCTRLAVASLAEMARLLYVDMTIEPGNLEVNNTESVAGEKVNVTVNITNNGNLNSTDFEVVFYCDGSPFETKILSVPSFGYNTTYAIWDATLGIHNISVVLDPKNEVIELDETNNSAWLEVVSNDKPHGVFTAAPMTVFTNDSIIFNGTFSYDIHGEVADFNFSYGDGNNSGWTKASVITHAYADDGIYVSSLTVRDIYNATSEPVFIKIQVLNRPPVANPNSNVTRALTLNEVQFQANANDPDGYIEYIRWEFDDGEESSLYNPVHTYSRSGIYNVNLILRDDDGAYQNHSILLTIDNRAPKCGIESNRVIGNITTEFEFWPKITDLDNGNFTLYWDFGDGSVINYDLDLGDARRVGKEPKNIYSKPGTYFVSLKVIDKNGAEGNANLTIIVYDLQPKLVAKAEPTKINSSETVYFTAAGSSDLEGPVLYYWDFGDGNSSTNESVWHTYTKPGLYKAMITIKDLSGQENISNFNITVKNRPPVAKFIAKGSFVENKTVYFIALDSYDPDGEIIYIWDFGDDKKENTESSPLAEHVYSTYGNYTVILTVRDDNGATDTYQETFSIKVSTSTDGGGSKPPKDNETNGKPNGPTQPTSPKKEEDSDSQMMSGLMAFSVILIIIIILLLVLLLLTRKKISERSTEPLQPVIQEEPPPKIPQDASLETVGPGVPIGPVQEQQYLPPTDSTEPFAEQPIQPTSQELLQEYIPPPLGQATTTVPSISPTPQPVPRVQQPVASTQTQMQTENQNFNTESQDQGNLMEKLDE